MKKKSMLLIFGLLFTKVFGIFRELALGNLYGPSTIADAYIIANNIPTVVYGFIAAGLVTTFIPIYSRIQNEEGELSANRFTANALNLSLIVSLVLAFLGFIFAEQIVTLFAVGFSAETQALAVSFTRVSIFSIAFLAVKAILEGYLQIKQLFNIVPYNGFILNIVVIGSIVLSYFMNMPMIMAWGIVLATVIQVILTLFLSRKYDYRHELIFDIKDKKIASMVKMAAPIILGSSIDQINKIIDSSIASSVMEGGVSTLSFAVKISDSILGIFVGAISTVLYPSLAAQAAKGHIEELKVTVNKVMVTVNLLIIPSTVGLMILAYPVLNVLYGRKFTPQQLDITTQALIWYTLGTIGFGLRQILVRTFYSLHDSITPVVSGIVSVSINVILNIVLSRVMGLAGLALATSIAASVSVVFLYISLRRKIGPMHTGVFLKSSIKIVLASLIMGAAVHSVYTLIPRTIGMVFSIIVGIIVYIIVIYLMQIEETDEVFSIIKKKISK